jgi:ParD-like antitoxin of type II bacterial toxin-antitoxin system
MPLPVKVSDRLLALAKEEAQSAHRSATGQIEHWATLGRVAEAVLAHGNVLALKKLGESLPVRPQVTREDLHRVLDGLTQESDRTKIRARIQAAGTPIYATDPAHPGRLVEIRADGTRIPGHLESRRFVADPSANQARGRKPLSRVRGRRRMRLSGITVAWRGTPNLDDWVAYIVNGTRSKKLILADHASERKVKNLISRCQTLRRKEIEKLAKS